MPRQTIRYAAGRAVRQTRRNHRAGINFGGRAAQTDPSMWPAPYAY